jgi:hypothetical protein
VISAFLCARAASGIAVGRMPRRMASRTLNHVVNGAVRKKTSCTSRQEGQNANARNAAATKKFSEPKDRRASHFLPADEPCFLY